MSRVIKLIPLKLSVVCLSLVLALTIIFATSSTPARAYSPYSRCVYVCITSIEMDGDTAFVVRWQAGAEYLTKRILRWWPENYSPGDPILGDPTLQAGQIDLDPSTFSQRIPNRLPYTKYIVEIESCDDGHCQGWSEQSYIVTPGNSSATDPAAVSWGAGRLDVVVRGPANDILHTYWDGSWHSYESLGGTFISDPAISTRGPGRLDVFGIGTDHRLYQKSWPEDAAVWTRSDAWHGIGGYFLSKPAAVSWAANRIDVVGRGGDNAVWHLYYDQGSGWGQDRLGNISSTQAAGWAPAIAAPQSGQLVVIAIGATDSSMYFKRWPQDGWMWNQDMWQHLGGFFTSNPAAVSRGADQVDVFGRGGDKAIWHAHGSVGGSTGASLASEGAHARSGGVPLSQDMDGSSGGPTLIFSPFEWIGGQTSGAPAATSQGSGTLDIFALYGHTLFQQSWTGGQIRWNQKYWLNLSVGQNVCAGCYYSGGP